MFLVYELSSKALLTQKKKGSEHCWNEKSYVHLKMIFKLKGFFTHFFFLLHKPKNQQNSSDIRHVDYEHPLEEKFAKSRGWTKEFMLFQSFLSSLRKVQTFKIPVRVSNDDVWHDFLWNAPHIISPLDDKLSALLMEKWEAFNFPSKRVQQCRVICKQCASENNFTLAVDNENSWQLTSTKDSTLPLCMQPLSENHFFLLPQTARHNNNHKA